MCTLYTLFYTHYDNIVNPIATLSSLLLYDGSYGMIYDTNILHCTAYI